jgi:hypothetical protein
VSFIITKNTNKWWNSKRFVWNFLSKKFSFCG